MGRGSMSQPSSPIKTRYPGRDSIVIDSLDINEKEGGRSDPSSVALLEMELEDGPRKQDYLDVEKQAGDGSRPRDK
ncbi:MAG: hypothetical protein Q9177_005552, partial [Variospora cf. flavescens]